MTHLCPTCNNNLDRKRLEPDALGEDVLRCRVCKRYSLEGLSLWVTTVDVEQLRKLQQQRDTDRERAKLMMEMPNDGRVWSAVI